ncbi:MAG: translocation/assembly module TamB, partial [Sphaerochaetaceae bacterium]|nr:translocation/assembly module TamB [Sphaerochaetaceae bacterium]
CADFINRTLDGSMTFRNTMKKADRDVCQGATVELSAKVDSLAAGALSLAGIDVDAEFELRLRDAYINDSYNLADTDMKVILNKDFYSVSGNMINGIFNRNARYVELSVNREFLAGFSLKGYIDEKVDLFVDDIYFPVEIIDTVTNVPFYHSRGGILEGALLVKGPVKDPSFYGTLYARTLDIDLLWIPDQVLSMKNVVITASGHTFSMGNVPLVGHSTSDRRFYKAEISLELSMQELGVTDMEFHLTIPDDPIDFWLPMYGHGTSQDVNIRGDVSGDLVIWIRNGVLGIDGEISASNTYVTFVIPDMPEWLKDLAVYCSCNLTVNMANNVEFMYPDAENPFLNFTIDEGEKLFLQYDSVTKILSAEGELEMKTGRIYYFQNDFNITEGKIKLKRPIGENSGVDLKFDLTAKIREYDRSGERVDIYLILQNSGFDNMRPRFVSTPTKKESEIIDILGSAVLQTKGRNFSFANIASAAAMATDAIQKLGIIKTNQVFSLASTIRDALGLDIFSAKSQVVENLILDAIPGKNSELSLISRYLNGTTVFAGKYLNKNLFARLTLLLKSERGLSQAKRAQGHFLASDLILDVEFSIDWDNLLGSFSVFTQPIELSVSSFLDNIGLSYSRRFKF